MNTSKHAARQWLGKLQSALADCLLRDRPGLEKSLRGLQQRVQRGKPADRGMAKLQAQVDAARARCTGRWLQRPTVELVDGLPISAAAERIAETISQHQVTVICGETGSGKTTQLPKLCLQLGRGRCGLIGHTQPRRIAARNVSQRIAEELAVQTGAVVGYQVRFNAMVGEHTLIKLMTDGILLAETQQDPDLLAYDTLIVDEAHERSLNIDFLLGYLKHLLPRRPDLKVIITSATIDPQRFARLFDDAPILMVSGRTWPVEVWYRPLGTGAGGHRKELPAAIRDAVAELWRRQVGDVLVFLPGERDIREADSYLRRHPLRNAEVLPLFARLDRNLQQRIFHPGAAPRIVLSTNVAETSLTVPRIRYVVDSGLARISRYSLRRKVQQLPVEPISQASANQRKGRCGRLSDGICVRLYEEEDFQARPAFTEPEILRTSLAAVILRMESLGLGQVAEFPFIDAPDQRLINDGYRHLYELGAVDDERRLSKLGLQLSRLPVEPRLGSMLLGGEREGCLSEMLIIVSGLSIQDPRERPMEFRARADQMHGEYSDEDSDFSSYLNLWRFFQRQRKSLGGSKLRKLCRDRFLSYMRMREWQDVHKQLSMQMQELGCQAGNSPADYAAIHKALLSGLAGHLGLKTDKGDYQGPRNMRFQLFPATGLGRKRPKWVMCGAMIETQRLYGHEAARIDPAWLEPLFPHLVKRQTLEPYWDRKSGRVMATENLTVYGLPVVNGRKVDFGLRQPAIARQIFLRQALIQGQLDIDAVFFRSNQKLIGAIEAMEAKARRRDVLVDEEKLFAFYDQRLPSHVHDSRGLARWLKKDRVAHNRELQMTRDELMSHAAEHVTDDRYPEYMSVAGQQLALRYHFEPGSEDDGVTASLPLLILNNVSAADFEWLVPGLLEQRVEYLIRGLKKSLRKHFVPAPDFARACMEASLDRSKPLLETLSHTLLRITGIRIDLADWQPHGLPEHLRMRFVVVDAEGVRMAAGRNLAGLQRQLGAQVRDSLREPGFCEWEQQDIRDWQWEQIPARVTVQRAGLELDAFPALVDQHDEVDMQLFDTQVLADKAHYAGLRRLLILNHAGRFKAVKKQLQGKSGLCMKYAAITGGQGRTTDCEQLSAQLLMMITDKAFLEGQPPVRERSAFERLVENGRGRLAGSEEYVLELMNRILSKAQTLGTAVTRHEELKQHFDSLIYPGFLLETPSQWLAEYPRYLETLSRRQQRREQNPGRDRMLAVEVQLLFDSWRRQQDKSPADSGRQQACSEIRWMLEEFRVSQFAQELKTRMPVSAKRIRKRLEAL